MLFETRFIEINMSGCGNYTVYTEIIYINQTRCEIYECIRDKNDKNLF